MAAITIFSWMVMISLQIQVDAGETTSAAPPTTLGTTTYGIIADELFLQLTDGPNRCAGNVEVFYFGDWVRVCGYLWDMQDAEVACRQLGCGSPLSVMDYFPSDSYWYMLTEVDCEGSEDYLWHCPFREAHFDCYHGAASVICSDSGLTVSPPTATATMSPTTMITSWPGFCGGFLQDLSGSIQSPNYPDSYPNSAHCVWHIQLWELDHRVQLQFWDVELEGSSCQYDAIEVYDGGSPEDPLLGMVCRNDHRIFTSSGHQMTILFHSDNSRTQRGFHAYYYSFPSSSSTAVPSTSSSTLPMSPATEYNSCGGLLSSPSGTLQSPFYPRNYPNNANCVWVIEAKNNFRITLSFRDVQMEGGRCLSDYVEVYDGPLHTSPLLGKFCSGSFRTYTSSLNLLTVRFHSNSRYTYRGFQADYYSTPADQSTTLLCLPDYMRVAVSRYYVQSHGYSVWNLTLKDPHCKPNITSNSVIFEIPYTRCGTVREGNNDTITYSNVIRGSSSGTVITRNKDLHLHVKCKMLQNTWAQTMYVVEDNFEVNETQYGRYDVNLTFYHSASFSRPVNEFPYYVDLDQNLFLEAYLHSSDPNLVLFVDTCVASATTHNFTTATHDIIRNGCVRDSTYATYYSPYRYMVRFKFNAFQFIHHNPVVYLQCELVVCRAYDYSSRCYQGCVTRSKRQASSGQESVTVVAGPIQLKEAGAEDRNERDVK